MVSILELEGKVLWSVKECCQALGIGRTKLDQLTAEGVLPTVVIGRRRLYPAQRVMEWVAGLPAENDSEVEA